MDLFDRLVPKYSKTFKLELFEYTQVRNVGSDRSLTNKKLIKVLHFECNLLLLKQE
jgi:hypothetical protein